MTNAVSFQKLIFAYPKAVCICRLYFRNSLKFGVSCFSPNGRAKTALLKVLLGLLKVKSGTFNFA